MTRAAIALGRLWLVAAVLAYTVWGWVASES